MSSQSEKKDKKFMVVGIRHFCNGEHHWFAPDGTGEYEDLPIVFGECSLNVYEKPAFYKLDDAVNWAMAMKRGERVLAQWEESRPTFVIVEEDTYLAIMDKDGSDYALPTEAEKWSDAKVADFERETDCEDFMNLRLWDSDTDEETDYAKEHGWCDGGEKEKESRPSLAEVTSQVNEVEGLTAYEDEGLLMVECHGEQRQAVADAILEVLPIDLAYKLEWVKSDEAVNIAWFKVDGFDPLKTYPLGKEG